MARRARLVVHPEVVRPAGHRAVVHPMAVVRRMEAHRARADHRVVVAPVVVPRVAACQAEVREAAPAVWKAESLVDPAIVRWQAATQDLVIPLAATSRCPVWSMKSRSTVPHRLAAAAAVVRAMAPARGMEAHQAVVRVKSMMETHHQAPPTGKFHPTQIQIQARQAVRAREVV